MKYILTYTDILERSSLTRLGVPNEVMRIIQRNYEIDENAEWEKITLKAQLKEILEKKETNLFIKITTDIIYIFGSLFIKDNKVYIIDRFDYNEDEEWGGSWDKGERSVVSLTGLLSSIYMSGNIYHLKSKDFKIEEYEIRNVKKGISGLQEFTEYFKATAITQFNKIIKKMYGYRAADILEDVIDNLHRINYNKKITRLGIRQILSKGINKEEFKKYYANYLKGDPKGLKSELRQDNSLTIFDEYLIRFESACSEKLDKFYTVKDLVNEFGMDKILTAFIYFIHTDKLMKLNEMLNIKTKYLIKN
jgi:hypothetical protein